MSDPRHRGKGVGLVVPSLLTWPGSAIVLDIKGENWQLTAGFRAQHGRVLLFDPLLPCTAAFVLGDLAGDRARGAGGARHHDRFTDVDLADLRDSDL
jgi:type IV secretory pathway TraG/TraD family ATPase VirD4